MGQAHQKQLSPSVNPLMLKKEVETRWNSTYIMIERVLQLRKPLERSYEDISDISPIVGIEWETLEEMM